jgi:hypothetical protein
LSTLLLGYAKGMPLLQVVITLVIIGFLLWLVNLIPMAPTISTILNAVVAIAVVVWLLQVFGLWHYVTRLRTPGT